MAFASRQPSYFLGSAGAWMQVVAGWWDVYSHLSFGNGDSWWNPAHVTLYFGIALVIIAVWWGLRTRPSSPSFISPIRLANVSGLKLAAFGSTVQIVAGAWNEIVHLSLGTEPRIAPAHALLTIGMLTVCLGMIVGLSVELGMIRQRILVVSTLKRTVIQMCVVLVFASIWLTAAGSFIYVARIFRDPFLNLALAVFLAIVATFVLVPAKRVLPWFGSSVAVGIVFYGVAYWFLVSYAEVTVYIPLGILYVAVFDALVACMRRVIVFAWAVIIASAGTGLIFYAAYYPFTQYLFPWSWAPSIWLAPLVGASMMGALLGLWIYTGLSSIVLRDVTREPSSHSVVASRKG